MILKYLCSCFQNLFDVCVPLEKVVGVVGCLSSDATLAVTSFCTHQKLPTISYSASSPDLDDNVNYPYFLRTVPSDEEQAIAMVEVVFTFFMQFCNLNKMILQDDRSSRPKHQILEIAIKNNFIISFSFCDVYISKVGL